MKLEVKEQETIRQYLLGQLPQEDSARLEERLLSDSEYYEELLISEDELIDQYLGGNLPQAERPGFETHFLAAPERQQRVRFARSLRKYVDEATATKPQANLVAVDSARFSTAAAQPRLKKRPFFSFLPANNPILSYSLAAVALLVAFGVTWIAIRNWRDRPTSKPGNVLAVVLTPGLTRDRGEIRKIQIPQNIDTLRLSLELSVNQYKSFRAAILTEERTEVWASEGLHPRENANVIDFDVPSRVLKPGDYQVKVSGRLGNGKVEEMHRFLFRVVK